MMTTASTNNFRIVMMAMVAVLMVACLFVAAKPAHAFGTYTIRSSADKPDVDPNDFECDADPNPSVKECTLRAAIQQANSATGSGHDTFNFDLAGGPGPKFLTLQSGLPFISDVVTINGYSQPGASENTLQSGTNAQPMIVLGGSQAGNTSGLNLSSGASGSVIKGLNIQGFTFDGIQLHGNVSGVKIEGNFIGTDPSGTQDLGNGRNGILLTDASDNTIGGASPAARNLISGNTSNGVATDVQSGSSEGNTVEGNLIGTQKNGTADLGNGSDGLELLGTHDNHVLNNTIAFNDQDGVLVQDLAPGSNRNEVLGNSIFSNAGHGIDLGGDGGTPNDVGDADSGANDSQNSPVISSATTLDGKTTIKGSINTNPHRAVILEFYSNPFILRFPPLDGVYEGKTYLGEKTVFTDDDGNASFTFTPSQSVPEGQRITATATNYDPFGTGVGSTSEFSGSRGVIVPDTKAPKILSTVPKPKATGVRPAANIKATFSENMLASSINAKTFKLFKKGSTTKVAAAVSYDAATDKATLNPTKSLQKGATYKVMVTTRAKDLAGNRLDQKPARTGPQPKVWFFKVKG